MDDELTPDRLRHIEARWKSDVDSKLDELRRSVAALQASIAELNTVLATGKGGVAFLFIAAKIMGAIGVIAAGVYGFKTWLIR